MSNKKIYEDLAPAAKIYCLIIAVPTALGILWFWGFSGPFDAAGAIFVLITQILISIIPDSSFQNTIITKILSICGFLSCAFVAYQLFGDFTLVNGADIGAIFLRTILLFSILSITLTIFNKKNSNQTLQRTRGTHAA